MNNILLEKQYLSLEDLEIILPFKKTKLMQLLHNGALPVVKIGRDYITTPSLLNAWISENIGKEIYYN